MSQEAIITIVIILISLVLFVSEVITIDLVALLVMIALVITGIITPQEGVAGFSNPAILTVAFMFVLSTALLKTGALQFVAHKLSNTFKYNFQTGMFFMMLLIVFVSAFVNNTPIVAVFIPVIIQIAHTSNQSPSKMLIPLSFASIMGGTCTIVGTSTNLLVIGIAEQNGVTGISFFSMTAMGSVFAVVGIIYMISLGIKLLPNRKNESKIEDKFKIGAYLTDIQLLEKSDSVGNALGSSKIVKELNIDVLEIVRKGVNYSLPSDDFMLETNDVLKVSCSVDKIKNLKDLVKIQVGSPIKIGDDDLKGTNASLVELIITSDSKIDGKTLREIDFKRNYRAIPLAIKHRKDVQYEDLYDSKLKSGDLILIEVNNKDLKFIKDIGNQQNAPFVLLSEDTLTDFDKKKFIWVSFVILAMIIAAATQVLDIMVGVITSVVLLVLTKVMNMKEVYEAINWKVIFLMAGAISLGVAMTNTGLDDLMADLIVGKLSIYGPIAILSGIYIITSFLTEIMSNSATAALLTPIAIACAHKLGVDPLPMVMAVAFAASASFLTPIGYHTNTMVYTAGQYKFTDFFKVGWILNIVFWVLATLLLPVFFPF